MFEDPEDQRPEIPDDPVQRAKEKRDEFRIHAELAAIFEGPRKFEAAIDAALDQSLAREIQRTIARLDKAKTPESPVLPEPFAAEGVALLEYPASRKLSPGDYHIHRRPGETMIVRWLEGEQVATFYERFQAHYDVAMNDFREEEKAAQAWRQDPKTLAYLGALEGGDLKMSDVYLREIIRKHKLIVLSTLAVDEMDIVHLCEYVMGVAPSNVVGAASAPPEEPTERDRAWFFKLFSLRGFTKEVERMCFFAYLQKTEDTFDLDE